MSEADLRSVNNIPPRMLIKAGSVAAGAALGPAGQTTSPASVADNGQLSLAPDVVLKRTTVKARKGDTVASLAQRYGVSAANVAEWNPGLRAGACARDSRSCCSCRRVRAAPRAQARTQAPAAGARAPARHQLTTKSRARRTSSPSTKAAAKPAAKAKR